MSRWIHLDGSIATGVVATEQVKLLLTDGGFPEGSEGPASVFPLSGGEEYGWWIVDGDLRDRDEEDVPNIVRWFRGRCEMLQPREAELQIDTGRFRFGCEWKDERLVLLVPRFYIQAMEEGWGVVEEPPDTSWISDL